MSFSSKVKEELEAISRKDFTLVQKQSKMTSKGMIREAFLQSGSISDPEKFYHLEIVFTEYEEALRIKQMMESFRLDGKIVERKGHYVVYLKEGAQIADMLRVMEAPLALMEFENIRIVKEMRNSINRQVNCEAANLGKTISAAVKQVEDILYLKEQGKLLDLPKSLLEIADLRLEYQDASLKELGGMLNPPVGKSGVNHRLRKISNYANEIREKEENKF